MKFFTKEWWMGLQEMQGPSPQHPGKAYEEYIATIEDRLPREFAKLNAEYSLHDGHVCEFNVEVSTAHAEMKLHTDDGSGGLQVVRMVFEGLRGVVFKADSKHGLMGPHGFGDFGYEETDIEADGTLVFRGLFSTGIEVEIKFAEFSISFADK